MITAHRPERTDLSPPGRATIAPVIRDAVARFDELRQFVRRHWIVALLTAMIAAVAAYAGSFLMAEEYRSSVTFFVDRSGRSVSLPAGLAAIGRSLGVGDMDEGQPLDLYAWLA